MNELCTYTPGGPGTGRNTWDAETSSKTVSVIIVSWNARGYLRDCLRSVRETGSSCVHEVIVVDNASSDGSPDMVEEEFPEVTLIRAECNLGFGRANNLAMRSASGAFLALINSDVIVHPGCLQTLVSFLRRSENVGMVGPRVTGGDGSLQRTCRSLPTIWNSICRTLALDRALSHLPLFSTYEMRHFAHDRMTEVEVLSGCFCVARREAIDEVGGFDEAFFFYGEDFDWCKRFANAGWKAVFVPQATATHFGGGSTANAPLRYSVEMLKASLQYWQKHHGAAGRVAFHALAVGHYGVRVLARALRRAVGFGSSKQSTYKLEQDYVCLRWLLTGRGV